MLDAWHTALTWFLFVAVWLLRASLLCNPQAFQWKHFYRHRQWQRGRDTARLFDCFVLFFCCFVLSLQTFCFYPSCSARFDFYQWHQASGFALHLLRPFVFRRRCWRMALGMLCVLWCTISVTHTHTPLAPLGWCTPSLFVLLWTWQGASLGRLPQPRVQYVQWILRQFFFFLSCVVFFQIIVWQQRLWLLFC